MTLSAFILAGALALGTSAPIATPALTTTPPPHLAAQQQDRTPLEKTHVDAAFITWDAASHNLDIRIRHGKKELDPDRHYLNLQAATYEGKDVSKFTIPHDHAPQLSFLGAPGDTVWNAPSIYYRGWLPIWAGFGSSVPKDAVRDGSLTLRLVRTEGPSWVETYNYNYFDGDVGRTISSKDAEFAAMTGIKNSTHWHSNWSFGAPGTYRMTFVAEGLTPNGTALTSPERTLVWQVGPGTPQQG